MLYSPDFTIISLLRLVQWFSQCKCCPCHSRNDRLSQIFWKKISGIKNVLSLFLEMKTMPKIMVLCGYFISILLFSIFICDSIYFKRVYLLKFISCALSNTVKLKTHYTILKSLYLHLKPYLCLQYTHQGIFLKTTLLYMPYSFSKIQLRTNICLNKKQLNEFSEYN